MEKQMGGNVILAYVQPPNVMCSRAPVDPPMHQYCVQTNVHQCAAQSTKPVQLPITCDDTMIMMVVVMIDDDDQSWLLNAQAQNEGSV